MRNATNGVPDRAPIILVVDDNVQLLETISLGLSREGFEVWAAVSGDQARAKFDRGDVPDLLLTDVMMPGELQGPDLVEYTKQNFPNMPAVLMSAHLGTGELASKGIMSADLVIAKPFALRELVLKLAELLREAKDR